MRRRDQSGNVRFRPRSLDGASGHGSLSAAGAQAVSCIGSPDAKSNLHAG
jgi:hypothetical protein